MLRMKKNIIEELLNHARKDAPVEACGYLAEKNGIISMHIPLTNVDTSAEHFSLDPKEQFDAVRKMRVVDSKLAAVYHSHPASQARPSQEDIRLAFDPSISYVIISLLDGNEVVKSFRIINGSVQEEVIVISDTVNADQR